MQLQSPVILTLVRSVCPNSFILRYPLALIIISHNSSRLDRVPCWSKCLKRIVLASFTDLAWLMLVSCSSEMISLWQASLAISLRQHLSGTVLSSPSVPILVNQSEPTLDSITKLDSKECKSLATGIRHMTVSPYLVTLPFRFYRHIRLIGRNYI